MNESMGRRERGETEKTRGAETEMRWTDRNERSVGGERERLAYLHTCISLKI